MFSTNPYTRRRQQKTAALFVVSGVFAAVGLVQALRAPTALPQTRLETAPDLASFGKIALAPGSIYQVELVGHQVRLRDFADQRLVAVQDVPSAQGVRFSSDGSKVLVHTLQLQGVKLQDAVISLDVRTGLQLSK
jgi:hypothetical protein